jgi:hypothetical protein
MALRILSGLIWANPRAVPQGGGFARISFHPFQLVAATAGVQLRKLKSVGGDGDFTSRPASIISARQFIVGDGGGVTFGINDTVSADEMTVRWRGHPVGNVHEEIPFLIVGEVADPARPPSGDVITIHVSDLRVRNRILDLLKGVDLRPEPSFGKGKPGKARKKSRRRR